MADTFQYNPESVHTLVAQLYRRATIVLELWPIIGVMAGGYAGRETAGNLGAAIGAALGGYLGYLIGSMRSLYYKVQAQTVLWQKQLEERTRNL